MADSSRESSVLEIPAAEPLAMDGRLKAVPGGLSYALREMEGSTLTPATLPLWSFCW
jgi:hypothetical protein